MVTVNQAKEFVLARWKAQWASTTPYVLENEDERTLDGGRTPWARLVVRNTGGGQDTLGPIGARKYLRQATVRIQIFTPIGAGSQTGDLLAHQARAIFEGARFNGLDFTDGTIREAGPNGKWFLTAVECLFDYEETK